MVKSCIIIVAVIYGPTPSITIESLPKAPPENRSKKPNNWLDPKNIFNLIRSTLGIGIAEKILKTNSKEDTISIFFLKSGVLKIWINFSITITFFYFTLPPAFSIFSLAPLEIFTPSILTAFFISPLSKILISSLKSFPK